MTLDPNLFIKAAKVYEASEPVEGAKPKEVYESHKKCAPGEFGMNKEGADPAFAGMAEAIPPKYTETMPIYRDSKSQAYRNSLQGTPAGLDHDRFRFSNRYGIGGPATTDIGYNRLRGPEQSPEGDDKAYRWSDGYNSPASLRGGEQTLQYGNPPAAGRTSPPRGTGMGALRPPVKPAAPVAAPMAKASAFEFGTKIAAGVEPSALTNGLRGAGIGAGLGGLYGLIAPGEEDTYDDEGNVIGKKQRNRFGAALRGALAGGVGGGVAGGVGGHYMQQLLQHLRRPAHKPVPNVMSQPTPFKIPRRPYVQPAEPMPQRFEVGADGLTPVADSLTLPPTN